MRTRGAGAGVAALLALAALWWLVQGGGRDSTGLPAEAPAGAPVVVGALVPPTALEPDDSLAPEASPESAAPESAAREERTVPAPAEGPRRRACIHGRLVLAGSGAPLDEALRLRLRAGDMSVVETLVTAADGSFVTVNEFPRHRVMVKVFRPAGDEAVDHEGWFDPALGEELRVPVPWPTFVHGTLVDAAGRPLGGVELQLSRGPGEAKAIRARTRDEGEFRVEGLSAGPRTLVVSRGSERATFALRLARGPNELGVLDTAFGARTGSIAGRLVAADGEPVATLLLGDARAGWVASTDSQAREGVAGESSFAFDELSPGDYTLEVLARDGRCYEPAAVRVSPPATELVFEAHGAQDRLTFVAGDAAEEDLGGVSLVRVRGQWLTDGDGFARADVERWILLAPRHRPASGERPPTSVVHARLEPGYGHAYLFHSLGDDLGFAQHDGARGRPLAGVEVVVDGRVVAASDADGLALVSLAVAPSEIEFRLAGWRLHAQRDNGCLALVALQREE